jgi:hypothetical protein
MNLSLDEVKMITDCFAMLVVGVLGFSALWFMFRG